MQFKEQNRYPFPLDAVLKTFANEDYFLAKYQLAGAKQIELIESTKQDGRSRITIRRIVDLDVDIPAFARKFVPHTITVTQTDSWDSATKTGRLDIDFKGMPAEVKCDMTLTDQGGETVLDLNFSVKINVPLVGEKLAAVVAEDLKQKFRSDSTQAQKLMGEFASRYV
ncbi:MAG: DUF2505 domain-containing protein [Alcanivoracaceae bacterium]|nr:DUF2505 domain-containing protein [Alcanivoracaceae bacterium]